MAYIPSQTFPDAARQAEIWVAELAEQLHCERRQAYEILRSVLHAVRDCISLQESVDLANHLPMLLRSLFYENWHPTSKPAQARVDLSAEVSRRLKHIEFDAKEEVVEEFFKLARTSAELERRRQARHGAERWRYGNLRRSAFRIRAYWGASFR